MPEIKRIKRKLLYIEFFFFLSFSLAPRRLSCTVIWLLTFPVMPTSSELPMVENVNAPKWLLINYCGECFTAVTLANTSGGSSCRCFLSVEYIRWLVRTHKHLQGGRTRQTTMNMNILRTALEGFCCFSFPFFSRYFFWVVGVWNIFGFVIGSCLNWRQFSIKDLFTNAARTVLENASYLLPLYTVFRDSFLMTLMFPRLKTQFLHFLYFPFLFLFFNREKSYKFCTSIQKWQKWTTLWQLNLFLPWTT